MAAIAEQRNTRSRNRLHSECTAMAKTWPKITRKKERKIWCTETRSTSSRSSVSMCTNRSSNGAMRNQRGRDCMQTRTLALWHHGMIHHVQGSCRTHRYPAGTSCTCWWISLWNRESMFSSQTMVWPPLLPAVKRMTPACPQLQMASRSRNASGLVMSMSRRSTTESSALKLFAVDRTTSHDTIELHGAPV